MEMLKSPFSEDQREMLLLSVEGLGLRPILITETGSKAWGTNVETSDHDFTVVAHDVDYDYNRWPRDSFTDQLLFGPGTCDVRYFSPQKFLRKLARSELVAYESVYSPYVHHGAESAELKLYKSVVDTCFDAREMYRSVIGSLQSVKHIDMKKKRRQQFRYMFVGLQLIDFLQNGIKPMVNIEQYRAFVADPDYSGLFAYTPLIEQLYEWAMEYDYENLDNAASRHAKEILLGFNYPKVVDFKQNQHREFLSHVLGRLMGKAYNWSEQMEDHEG